MHSPKANSLKDLKLIMGEEKIYVVTEEDLFEEASTILATFKTFLGAKKFAKERALKARRQDEYIEESELMVEIRDSDDVCYLEYTIKEFTLNA